MRVIEDVGQSLHVYNEVPTESTMM